MSNNPFRTWINNNTADWQDGTPCSSVVPDIWFPEKGESALPAKLICAGCDVREQCLQWALDNGEKFGIWGGKSELERRRMVKERAA